MTARDRTVLLVVAALGLVAGFWFLGLAPRRDEVASLDAQIATVQTELDTARAGAANAQQAKDRYESDYATVAQLGKAVPADDDVPSLLYQLESAARQSSVDFRAIRMESQAAPAATPTATPGAAAAAIGNAEKDKQGTTTTPAGAASAPATEASAATLPPGATIGPAGFPTMPFSFTFTGSFLRLEKFLDRLEAFTKLDGDTIRVRGRLLTIDGVGLTAGPDGFPSMKAQIAATAYLLPADQAVVPPAPGSAGASATTATASTTSSSTPAPAVATTPGGTK